MYRIRPRRLTTIEANIHSARRYSCLVSKRCPSILTTSHRHQSRILSPQQRPSTNPFLTPRHSIRPQLFHSTPPNAVLKPQILKDVGEGITEVQIIQWYVQEGALVEEWAPLCQYQSDKAVDDITARYTGVIRKLHYEADDTVSTGKALCDFEVQDDSPPTTISQAENTPEQTAVPLPTSQAEASTVQGQEEAVAPDMIGEEPAPPRSRNASLATPAVRGLLKEHQLDITHINGTGKDGRVLKEDVHTFLKERRDSQARPSSVSSPSTGQGQIETSEPLSLIQAQMFKSMTKSLTIPHFLYADDIDLTALSSLRETLATAASAQKISALSFIVKAVSMMLTQFPILNAKIDLSNPAKPALIHRSQHNIGIAIDSPSGLIVPSVKNVTAMSIGDVAVEIKHLVALSQESKLSSSDLKGTTITVSNIGSIGGTVVSPIIVEDQVAILGVGKTRTVPVFDQSGMVVPRESCCFSWAADHRVVDGATMARAATVVKGYVEKPETMIVALR